jgi:hydrogenase maturation factor HypF (carbamoyltransferase family)
MGWKLLCKVQIENIETFIQSINSESLPVVRIDHLDIVEVASESAYEKFEIRSSINTEDDYQPISSDIAICPDCERELFDPKEPTLPLSVYHLRSLRPAFYDQQGYSI